MDSLGGARRAALAFFLSERVARRESTSAPPAPARPPRVLAAPPWQQARRRRRQCPSSRGRQVRRGCRMAGQISRTPPHSVNADGPRVALASSPAFQERARAQNPRPRGAPSCFQLRGGLRLGPPTWLALSRGYCWARRPLPLMSERLRLLFLLRGACVPGLGHLCAGLRGSFRARAFLSAVASRVAARLGRGPPLLRRASATHRGPLSRCSRRRRSVREAAAPAPLPLDGYVRRCSRPALPGKIAARARGKRRVGVGANAGWAPPESDACAA